MNAGLFINESHRLEYLRYLLAVAVALAIGCEPAPYDRSCAFAADCVLRPIDDYCSTCLAAINGGEAARADADIEWARQNCEEIVVCENDDVSGRTPIRLVCDSGLCTFGQTQSTE